MSVILKAEGISKTYRAGSVDIPALKESNVEFRKENLQLL